MSDSGKEALRRASPSPAGSPLPRNDEFVALDLYLTFDDVSDRLLDRLRAARAYGREAAELPIPSRRRRRDENLLDCFLLAAGLNQILEDYLHRDLLSLISASKQLELTLTWASALAGALGRAGSRLRATRRDERRLALRQRKFALLVDNLAHTVVHADDAGDGVLEEAEALLLPADGFPPGLRRAILRVPNCFRSFDQQPEDCRRLARLFAAQWDTRSRSLLVVGLRTSGSYLAPLYVNFLRAEGYRDVSAITIRPGRPFGRHEARAIASVAKRGGLGLLVDDPPRTGGQLALAARTLLERGLPPILLLQLFDDGRSLPESLRGYPLLVLPWEEWAIQEHLRPEAVGDALSELLVGNAHSISDSENGEIAVTDAHVDLIRTGAPTRGHASALFSVRLPGPGADGDVVRPLYVVGAGLGFFGRQALGVARALTEFVPSVYGLQDGLLFRAWLPEQTRITPRRVRKEKEAIAAKITEYVQARNQLLSAKRDASLTVAGTDTAWKLVGQMLSAPFGRAAPFGKVFTYRVSRRLLRVEHPSVIDGDTAPWEWFGDTGAPLKPNFHELAFSTLGLAAYDPIFDLAGAAAAADGSRIRDFESLLRHRYEETSETSIGRERWLLYRLLHLLFGYETLLKQAAADPLHADTTFARLLALERAMASVHRDYFEEQYFRDLAPLEQGPLCAIDIDGVLETRWLAFPAIGPAGALAIRALNRHGYRAVLATGRSLEEILARCRAYRLAGGAAEYGSVVYSDARGRARSLLTPSQRADLQTVREVVRGLPGVYVDPPYRHSVRAHTLGSDSRRQGLSEETIATIIADAGVEGRVRVVAGALQTDFVAAGIDKGAGLRALAEDLGEEVSPGKPFLALAAGDTDSDLPMLELAEKAVVPANATAAVRSRAKGVRAAGQAGLLLAVRQHLGHTRCEDCVPPTPQSTETRLLLAAMGVLDGGRRTGLARAAALAFQLASTRDRRSSRSRA